ncbi:unnamed protein product [Moneuplotes crassus]|uniref:Uncharacterized protein n=1 Tax=Euplotes crassus TaxID=5936 RepID=A0AAD1YA13_EUPCR|nr:unnamed protein product [Moneuplotes crassus]
MILLSKAKEVCAYYQKNNIYQNKKHLIKIQPDALSSSIFHRSSRLTTTKLKSAQKKFVSAVGSRNDFPLKSSHKSCDKLQLSQHSKCLKNPMTKKSNDELLEEIHTLHDNGYSYISQGTPHNNFQRIKHQRASVLSKFNNFYYAHPLADDQKMMRMKNNFSHETSMSTEKDLEYYESTSELLQNNKISGNVKPSKYKRNSLLSRPSISKIARKFIGKKLSSKQAFCLKLSKFDKLLQRKKYQKSHSFNTVSTIFSPKKVQTHMNYNLFYNSQARNNRARALSKQVSSIIKRKPRARSQISNLTLQSISIYYKSGCFGQTYLTCQDSNCKCCEYY